MNKIFFKTAFRNLLRNRANTGINLLSLTIGMTVSIVIFTLIKYQYTFDHYHTNADRVYRVNFVEKTQWGANYGSQTPEPLHKVLRTDYPQIEAVSRTIGPIETRVFIEEEKFDESKALFVDENYFQMFDQEWLRGNPEEAFSDPQAVILTESTAKRYFGDEDPMGQTIDFARRAKGVVRGIIVDPRLNTNLPYTMLANVAMMPKVQEFYVRNTWSITSMGTTWVLLPENVDPVNLASQFNDIVVNNLGDEAAETISFELGALKSLHTDDRYSGLNYTIPNDTIYGLLIIAFIVLATCTINFVNLSTAQVLKRSQEVGIKKIIGCAKSQLANQFFLELSIVTSIATFFSIWIAEVLLNEINEAMSVISIDLKLEMASILFAIGLGLILTFLAGLYPVGMLVNFKPLEVIRSKFTQVRGRKAVVRNTLLTVQFVVAQILVISVLIFNSQFSFIKNKDLGYDTKNIIGMGNFVPGGYRVDAALLNSAKSQLMESPFIENVTFGTGGPNAINPWNTTLVDPESTERIEVNCDFKHVDVNYAELFNLKVIAGKWFSAANYQSENREIVVTELALQKLGWDDPQSAIGRRVNINGYSDNATIVGVLADFHTDNLRNEIKPSVFEGDYSGYNQAFVKVKEGYYSEVAKHIDKVSASMNPDFVANYKSFTDEIAIDYEIDRTLFGFINATAILAIAIGCLGLYSLIAFVVQQKTKELGIRKVVGANTNSLVLLLSSKYIWLIAIATVIAVPFGFYGTREWLNSFVYQVEVSPLVFVSAFLLTILIALLSIGYRAFKAATANPVKALRYE
ncbi:ABC transporter permease [Roseivirga sp. E12]|uniref:ABC transporter permease n=1 Tax=Roseivirga sp. E12 TaxID=2819237 RepID=UPI001ABCC2E2|nr:ABC transporter permease [Roseivirga sp. E12]MBO3699681.1 ABC transporter permease [Roseivirga sp. E12]